MSEPEIFKQFCESASAMMEAGLRFAKNDDPALYTEVCNALEAGRARPELVVEFRPRASVSLRLIGEMKGALGEQCVQVFSYTANALRGTEID